MLALAGAWGCAAPPPAVTSAEDLKASLPFLEINATTREDLVLRLGSPDWSFEDGRIMTWSLVDMGKGTGLETMSRFPFQSHPLWWTRQYDLVVIFGPEKRVTRFGLRNWE